MDASSKIQRSIHDVRLIYKYVSRILGTYHDNFPRGYNFGRGNGFGRGDDFTRVFRKFTFHTARNLSIITLHSLISLSRLHAAFAGLVLGSLKAGIPVCFSQYL